MASPFAFVFALCQPACQKWLKLEVSARHPELRFAYNRPGLVTFKAQAPLASTFRFLPSFARHWGFSLGLAHSADDVRALVDAGFEGEVVVQVCSAPEREGADGRQRGELLEHEEEQAPLPPVQYDAAAFEEELVRALVPRARRGEPVSGDWVLDVVRAPRSAPDAGWLVGVHRHEPGRSPHPGGPEAVAAPEHSPSRAYSKIEEAIRWQDLAFMPGQRALELGSAPGGAVLSLLERGLDVVALDPADLDAGVIERATTLGRSLVHLQKPAAALESADLPGPVDWLLCDMNLAPQVAVRAVERAVSLTRRSLRGAVVTLKMNDARAVAAIPALLERLTALKLGSPRSIQLPSHRSEIAVVVRR